MMSFGLAGRTSVLKLPMLLDLELYVPKHAPTPREAVHTLTLRTLEAHPGLRFHISMDSRFGAFSLIPFFAQNNVTTTMSMSEKQKGWLWDFLLDECPLDAGRLVSKIDPQSNKPFLVSAYRVENEKHQIKAIKTVTTAFSWTSLAESEVVVSAVGGRRLNRNNLWEYETMWNDGDITWKEASAFIDEDGTLTHQWLDVVKKDDLEAALRILTKEKLSTICNAQGWRVPA